MRSGRLLLALLLGLLLTIAAVGAWTATSQGAAAPPDNTAVRFSIVIDGHDIGSFGQLDGIRSGYEADALELSAKKLAVPGKRTPPTVTLTRGMSNNMELTAWHEQAMNDWASARKSASLVMYDATGQPVARYNLENAWPAKLEIGALKAGASEVLLETVTLVCENLQRVSV